MNWFLPCGFLKALSPGQILVWEQPVACSLPASGGCASRVLLKRETWRCAAKTNSRTACNARATPGGFQKVPLAERGHQSREDHVGWQMLRRRFPIMFEYSARALSCASPLSLRAAQVPITHRQNVYFNSSAFKETREKTACYCSLYHWNF